MIPLEADFLQRHDVEFIVIFHRISQGAQWCAQNFHLSSEFFSHHQEGIFGRIFKIPKGLDFNGVRKGSHLYLFDMISHHEFSGVAHFVSNAFHF